MYKGNLLDRVRCWCAHLFCTSGTIDIILKSCIMNRHKLRQSQIATLSSQFVICRNLWSRPWRGVLTPITLKTCYGYLGEYSWHEYEKFHICRFWCYFTVTSVRMYISYKSHNRCTKETFLIGSDVDVNIFSALRSIKTVTAQTESNNTENVFCVLGRVPRFTFDMNMKTYIFVHSGVISLVYLFVCMYISYKAHNRCSKETFLIGSDVDVNIFSALRSIPYGTIDINLKSCILNRHKLRQ